MDCQGHLEKLINTIEDHRFSFNVSLFPCEKECSKQGYHSDPADKRGRFYVISCCRWYKEVYNKFGKDIVNNHWEDPQIVEFLKGFIDKGFINGVEL